MDDGVLESELLDVTDLDLDQLDALPDSVLRAALRRILMERIDAPDRYTIHESSL
jgi:FXSXX-COOH protein